MSVARCQAEVDCVEFGEWMADYNIRRWEHDDDERTALLAAVVVNHSQNAPRFPAKVADFMPRAVVKEKHPDGYVMPKVQPQDEMRNEWMKAVRKWPKPRPAEHKKD